MISTRLKDRGDGTAYRKSVSFLLPMGFPLYPGEVFQDKYVFVSGVWVWQEVRRTWWDRWILRRKKTYVYTLREEFVRLPEDFYQS